MSTRFGQHVCRALRPVLVSLVPLVVSAQRAPRPLLEGDSVRIGAASLGLQRLRGYAGLVYPDSIVVLSGTRLRPRSIPRLAITRMEVHTRVRSPRKSRAFTGAVLGYLGVFASGMIACGGEENCQMGAGLLAMLVGIPGGAAIAALPPSTAWQRVDPLLEPGTRGRGATTRLACCGSDTTGRATVTVPELTPVNLEFEEAAHDLMQRPLTLQLRVTHEVVVDGRTVVEHGARARAPISTSERPSRWNHPGTIVVLVASVPTVDGQDLVLGSIVAQTGRRRDGLGKAFAPWLPGGHATIAAGTRVTSYTSAPLTVRLP